MTERMTEAAALRVLQDDADARARLDARRAVALRALVEHHDYTVKALAEWFGVTRATIYRWMRHGGQ